MPSFPLTWLSYFFKMAKPTNQNNILIWVSLLKGYLKGETDYWRSEFGRSIFGQTNIYKRHSYIWFEILCVNIYIYICINTYEDIYMYHILHCTLIQLVTLEIWQQKLVWDQSTLVTLSKVMDMRNVSYWPFDAIVQHIFSGEQCLFPVGANRGNTLFSVALMTDETTFKHKESLLKTNACKPSIGLPCSYVKMFGWLVRRFEKEHTKVKGQIWSCDA